MIKISSSLLFYRQRNQGAEKLHNLLKTTQLGSSRAGLSPGILLRSRVISSYAIVPDTWSETRWEERERELL